MIITNLKGGLGNQMFQYAAGIALAERHNVQLKVDINFLNDQSKRLSMFTVRDFGLDMFNITAARATYKEIERFVLPRNMNRYLYQILQSIRPKRHYYKDVSVDDFLRIPADAYITGYWHDKAYFAGHESRVRQEFTFRNQLPLSCKPFEEAIRSAENPIAMHVRRGDYVGHPSLDGVVGREYYMRAIEFLEERIEGELTFFVFSDDLQWCREELPLSHEKVVFVDLDFTKCSAESDFHLMTLCSHFVIANSSFSYWGAWLSNAPDKVVVAPAKWKHGQDYDKKPILPDDWEVL